MGIKCREQISICSFQNFKFQLEYEEAKFAGLLYKPRPNKEMRIDPLMNERGLKETTPGKIKCPFREVKISEAELNVCCFVELSWQMN